MMALIEEHSSFSVDVAMVRDDPREAARAVARERENEITEILTPFRGAERLRVAFLVDTTDSMTPHIGKVKQQIQMISSQLVEMTPVTQRSVTRVDQVAMAFVGYKDFCDGEDHFEIFPFSSDISAFQSFVAAVSVRGGGDTPEDVNGGLRAVLDRLNWEPLATKLVFHMADAPPHGSEYSAIKSNDVSIEGSRRNDEPIRQLFQRMMNMEIDYYFGRVNTCTDQMVEVFSRALGHDIQIFDVQTPLDLSESVLTAATMSRDTRVKSSLSATGAARASVVFDRTLPDWNALPFAQGALVSYKHPMSISSICGYTELEWVTRRARVKIAPAPFAQGSVRLAFFAKEFFRVQVTAEPAPVSAMHHSVPPSVTADSSQPAECYSSKNIVCKVFKPRGDSEPQEGRYIRYRYMIAMETQTIASYLAKQFNLLHARSVVNPGFAIYYLKCKVLVLKDEATRAYKYYVVEKRLETEAEQWLKVINNAGSVTRGIATLDRALFEYLTAFAHWTYCASNGYLMVTDLQGIVTSVPLDTKSSQDSKLKAEKTVLLTDPAIHCTANTRFGRTNLGTRGMMLFFESHVCNRFCSALHLTTPRVENARR